MDKVNFEMSTKSIPVVDNRQEYHLQFTHSVNELACNVRWKTKKFLGRWKNSEKETFGFKSTKMAPPVPELEEFESKLFDLAKEVKFRDQPKSNFQRKLAANVAKVRKDTKVIVGADKSSNFYRLEPEAYQQALLKDIHADYKKADEGIEEDINTEAFLFAAELDIEDRVYKVERRQAVVTLKDHKDNFLNNPETRLINPTKSELGKVVKVKMAKVLNTVRAKSGLTQWKSDLSVVRWFKSLEGKRSLRFIEFDIKAFYPNISRDLLTKSLDWASTMVDIPEEDRDLIMHTRRSILVNGEDTWVKKGEDIFDVTMGAFDGAEICDIVGLYLLSQINHMAVKGGLYRDDGLLVSSLPPKQVHKQMEEIIAIFETNGLQLKAKCNTTVANFLDVTFDLKKEQYMPYRKPGTPIEYIHIDSNHPRHVTKNTVAEVSKRLSNLSSSKEIFDAAKGIHEEALKRAGYSEKLTFKPEEERTGRIRRTRHRELIWFNPPYCMTVETRIGQKFLNILDSCFPVGHPLRRILNRHTVQLSYRTMPNLSKIIAGHNVKVINNSLPAQRPFNSNCNCRGGTQNCPLEGARCLDTCTIYQAEVSAVGKREETYIGLSKPDWKGRYNNHTDTFRHSRKRVRTSLAGYIWQLQDEGVAYTIKWKTIATARAFTASSKKCRLCLMEKVKIMHTGATLNRRTEFFSSCRHKESLLV